MPIAPRSPRSAARTRLQFAAGCAARRTRVGRVAPHRHAALSELMGADAAVIDEALAAMVPSDAGALKRSYMMRVRLRMWKCVCVTR